MVSSDIPLHKLKNEQFRNILNKYIDRPIPDESTFRKTYVYIYIYTYMLSKNNE